MDYYGYADYGYGDFDSLLGIFSGLAIFLVIIALISLAVYIIQLIGYWKMYKKAGKGGWEAIIPFYCNWVLVEIAGLNWWWFLFFFAPIILSFIGLGWLGGIAYLFGVFNCYYNIAKKFNKDTGFAVCLTLFTPICIPILGFSKNCQYDSSVVVSNNGVFGASSTPNNNYQNNNYNNYQNNHQQQPMYNNNVMNDNMNVSSNENNNMDSSSNQTPVQEFSFCGNCGTKLNKDVKFCPNCGKERL